MNQTRHHDALAGVAQRRRKHGQRAGQHPAVGVEHQYRVQAVQVQRGDTRIDSGGVPGIPPKFDDPDREGGQSSQRCRMTCPLDALSATTTAASGALLGQRLKAVTDYIRAVVRHDDGRHPGQVRHACPPAVGRDRPRRRLNARAAVPRARRVSDVSGSSTRAIQVTSMSCRKLLRACSQASGRTRPPSLVYARVTPASRNRRNTCRS